MKQIEAKQLKGELAFENVKFAYIAKDYVLKDLSFNTEAGKTLAIVGSTGSGKTTIISILNRFYELNSGKITIDGIEIRDYELHSLRSRVAVVLQDVFLFSGSVFENITLRDERISREARRQDTPLDRIESICRLDPECPDAPGLLERVLTEVRYEGYIERQHRDVARQKREESVLIPSDLDPAAIQGLRNEARDALLRYRPGTLGQAGRIEGITPSDLTLVAIAIKRRSSL